MMHTVLGALQWNKSPPSLICRQKDQQQWHSSGRNMQKVCMGCYGGSIEKNHLTNLGGERRLYEGAELNDKT